MAYGIARDILGGNDITLEINEGLSAAGVLDLLKEDYPDFGKLTSLMLAVNEDYVADDYVIGSGDEVVLIPPVSGG